MNLEEFNLKYAAQKDANKIEINCDHPDHEGGAVTIGKQPARRNILKNGSECFICRACMMKYDNPMNRVGQRRDGEEAIDVYCPCSEHVGDRCRAMAKSCYYGKMEEPYLQVCRSCSQKGHQVSEQTRELISEKLKGRKLSPEHVEKIMAWREAHPEWAEKTTGNLIPGQGGGWNAGQKLPEETKAKMSASHMGKEFTEEHCQGISEGRKKMLQASGGFTREHRENISKATLRQYAAGFDPKVHHLKGMHTSPKAGEVRYRSSYEKKAYLKLDVDDTVKTYRPEAVTVEYLNPKKGITSSYIIDLEIEYMDGTKKLVEIKPAKWLTDAVVIAKIDAGRVEAQRRGLEFEVWTELNLFGHVYNEKHLRYFARKIKAGEI